MLSNLKDLRKEFGFSQKQMAEKLAISQQTYSDYENCKTEPTMDTLISITKIFNVSLDYLVGIVDEFGMPLLPNNITKTFTSEERDLIKKYRSLPEKIKKLVRDQLDVYCQPNEINISDRSKK